MLDPAVICRRAEPRCVLRFGLVWFGVMARLTIPTIAINTSFARSPFIIYVDAYVTSRGLFFREEKGGNGVLDSTHLYRDIRPHSQPI